MIAKKQLYLWEFFISQSVINIGLQKMVFPIKISQECRINIQVMNCSINIYIENNPGYKK